MPDVKIGSACYYLAEADKVGTPNQPLRFESYDQHYGIVGGSSVHNYGCFLHFLLHLKQGTVNGRVERADGECYLVQASGAGYEMSVPAEKVFPDYESGVLGLHTALTELMEQASLAAAKELDLRLAEIRRQREADSERPADE